jgi:hypothetical protein
MTEEERNRLKEQIKQEELADLKQRKAFLNRVNEVKKQQPLTNALNEIEKMASGEGDDTNDWLNLLNQETALMDAKTEMSLEMEEEKQKKLEQINNQLELEKLNAKKLVEDMKRSMGLLPAETPELDETKTETPEVKPQGKKTLGDF